MGTPNWQNDLFGGRDKVYTDRNDNEVRLSQSSEDREANLEQKGKEQDYPHYTHNHEGDNQWHYSSNSKTHSDSWSFEDKGEEQGETSTQEENKSEPLF